jgi:hypothetical protein
VPVGLLTGQGEEHRSRGHQPRVGLDGSGNDGVVANRLGQEQGATKRLRELGQGECDHAQPASRKAARASSRAEYGVRTPSMSR